MRWRTSRRNRLPMDVRDAGRINSPRMRTIWTSRSKSGCSTQWYRQRRFSASCTSRVRLDVRITTGGIVVVNTEMVLFEWLKQAGPDGQAVVDAYLGVAERARDQMARFGVLR